MTLARSSFFVAAFLFAATVSDSAQAAFRFTGEDPLAAAREGAPMALTAGDGTGLVLVGMKVNAVLQGPLAYTELHLKFQNPQDRVLEGRFQITLPARASVSRFAMRTDTRWQEGEVIERERARRVYEDFLHRRQDPALLEQGTANEFTARVFPIPAKGVKELILSYAQPLASSDQPYVLPLRGLPRIGSLSVDIQGGASPVTMKKSGFVPTADVRVMPAANASSALRSGELVAVRVRPVLDAPPANVESLLFLVDTSASRALAMRRQQQLIETLTRALVDGGSGNARIGILAFDQDAALLFDGKARDLTRKNLRKLRQRRALGASDLGRALDVARTLNGRFTRALLITDGVVTAGEQGAAAMTRKVSGLSGIGVRRLDAAMLGGLRDEERLRALTTAGLKNNGAVIDADQGAREVGRKMARATRSKVALQIEGSEWTWPTSVSGVQPGDDVLVFARLEKGVKTVRVRVNGKRQGAAIAVTKVARPLLERAVVEAEIAKLAAAMAAAPRDKKAKRLALKNKIIALSTKFRVLSRFTSLLVLETAADYARYGIKVTALSEILVVKNGKIALQNRTTLAVKPVPKPKPRPKNKRPAKGKKKMSKKSDSSGAKDMKADGRFDFDDAESDEMEASKLSLEEAKEEEEGGAVERERSRRGGGGNESEAPMDIAAAPAAESAPMPVTSEVSTGRRAPAPARSMDRSTRSPPRSPPPPPRPDARPEPQRQPAAVLANADAWTGKFKTVMDRINAKNTTGALQTARGWREEDPGDVLALVALGRALVAKGQIQEAARAYGSIVDLHPARADLRRFAGNLLESLDDKRALRLASESYRAATEQRSDHPAGWRLLAFSLARQGDYEGAMVALETAIKAKRASRFGGVAQILAEDLGLVASMRIRAQKGKGRAALEKRVKAAGGIVESKPSVRFVLSWETDANDVDFHIYDDKGGHAFYSSKTLPSGGSLYADITSGYGPECFTVRTKKSKRAGPYKMQAHYYSRGPMGYGMGALQVIDHDNGKISVKMLPFVVMKDSAYVDLGGAR